MMGAGNASGPEDVQLRTAMLSAWNKKGLEEFARDLHAMGFRTYGSQGTARNMAEQGIPTRDVAELSGMGPIMNHRVVTLVPQVHGGLLAKNTPEDLADLAKLNGTWIDLVYVNLYPFEQAVADPKTTFEQAVEMIDIGGPTMLRSGAKGDRVPVCDVADLPGVLSWLRSGMPDAHRFKLQLRSKVFETTARYDLAIASYLSEGGVAGLIGTKVADCKYGENAPQKASLYKTDDSDPLAIHKLHVEGQPPSFVGTTDYQACQDILVKAAAGFDTAFGAVPYMAVWVKHGTPGGAAYGNDPAEVIRTVIRCDPEAMTGAVLMTNFPIDFAMAQDLRTYLYTPGPGAPRRVLDGVGGSAISAEARKELERVDIGKCRTFTNPALAHLSVASLDRSDRFRQVRGGFLRQTPSTYYLDFGHPKLQVNGNLTEQQKRDLLFGSAICAGVRSNTVVLVKDGMLLGIGCNQTKRDRAVRVAYMVAAENGLDARGAVLVSDSFFVEMDGPEFAMKQGVAVICTTNRPEPPEGDEKGWARKERVDAILRDLCLKHGVVLVEIPDNYGRQFSGHG